MNFFIIFTIIIIFILFNVKNIINKFFYYKLNKHRNTDNLLKFISEQNI